MTSPTDREIVIDGSLGEGGGQILRSALALSLTTGKPFRIEKIRAGREKPGLLRQHLTAVEAARTIGAAEVSGAALGSRELAFAPGHITPGEYAFAVGTAGSATLVLQTVLPALLTASGPSTLVLEGGTHNPYAPPFDFLAKAVLPLIHRMGPRVEATLERPGFYPAGGGKFSVRIEPVAKLGRIEIPERGEIRRKSAVAVVSALPESIAAREAAVLREKLSLERTEVHAELVRGGRGPGNVVILTIESEHVTEVFTGFGERGVRSEEVAGAVAEEATAYLSAGVPVGAHLADQLLLPMALAGGGSFVTLPPTAHTMTNAEVLRRFLDAEVVVSRLTETSCRIEVSV